MARRISLARFCFARRLINEVTMDGEEPEPPLLPLGQFHPPIKIFLTRPRPDCASTAMPHPTANSATAAPMAA
jgi:hypothetical protein